MEIQDSDWPVAKSPRDCKPWEALIPLYEPGNGLYPYQQAAREIADFEGWDDSKLIALEALMVRAINDGSLPRRCHKTGAKTEGQSQNLLVLTTVADVNKWLKKIDIDTYTWTRQSESPLKEAAPEQNAATPAPVVAVDASDAPAIPKNQRPDLLTPLIEKAQRGETDVFSAAVIWPKLCDMAECKTTPFIGKTESGLQWIDANDNPQFLTKDALGDRLRRQKKAAIERGKPR